MRGGRYLLKYAVKQSGGLFNVKLWNRTRRGMNIPLLKKKGRGENMGVVARYKIGNTRISICDDCWVKTEAEKKEILGNLSSIIGRAIRDGMVFEDKPMEFPEKMIPVDENWEPITQTPEG